MQFTRECMRPNCFISCNQLINATLDTTLHIMYLTSQSYTRTNHALIHCVGDPADADVLFFSGGIDANENVYADPSDSEQTWLSFYCPRGVASIGLSGLEPYAGPPFVMGWADCQIIC